jgi:hypothetical protein
VKVQNLIFLIERTLNSLVSVTSANFGGSRQKEANQVQVRNIQYTPSIPQGVLYIKCETFSGRDSGPYNTVLELTNINFVDREEGEADPNSFSFTATDGNLYYMKSSAGVTIDVRVGCSCEDFRWRFAVHNHRDGSLAGEPPPAYARRTNRPPVNPSRTPGVCKHLIKLKNELERENFFRRLLN